MNEIKRSDRQYVEIEEFADYELTQCIAYEMAFRNQKNIIKINDIIDYYRKHRTKIDNIILGKLQEPPMFLRRRSSRKNLSCTRSLSTLNYMITGIDFLDKNYKEKRLDSEFLDILEKVSYYKSYSSNHEEMVIDDGGVCTEVIKVEYYSGYKLEMSFVPLMPPDPMSGAETQLPHDYTFDMAKDDAFEIHKEFEIKLKGKRQVTEELKRPKIDISGLDTTDTFLEVNLNKPLKEIIAYIEHIKNDMEDNSLLKAPIEDLGEILEKVDTKLSKKKLADKFFVYDYVKARLEEIEEINKETHKAFNKEVEQIKNKLCLDGTDKDIQINMLKKDLRGNVINTSINDIFEEKELTSSTPKGTAKRYYYEMKPYIEDEKYKELITGIRT